jgi:hypothetical protein
MVHTDVRDDAEAPLRAQMAGFASPLTRMLLAGNGLTTPVLEAALCTALRRESAAGRWGSGGASVVFG